MSGKIRISHRNQQINKFFRFSKSQLISAIILFFGISVIVLPARAQRAMDPARGLEGVGVTEKLGQNIPLDLEFTDSEGNKVTTGELLKDGKPVILNLAYFSCPMLCPMIMAGLSKSAGQLEWSPGDQYNIWTVSFDPKDTPDVAAVKRKIYLDSLNRRGANTGWRFFTGDQDQITKLTEAVGFDYRYLPEKKMFAHTAALIFISPKGKISRYLYGITFNPLELKGALSDAAGGNIGSTLDKVILYCCQYDPKSGTYIASAINIMKLSGIVVMFVLGGFLTVFWIREKKSKNHKQYPTDA